MRLNIESRALAAPRRRYFLREVFGIFEAVAAVLIFLSLIGKHWIGLVGEVVHEHLIFVLGQYIAFVLPAIMLINAGQLIFGRTPVVNHFWSVIRGLGGLVLLLSTCGIFALHLELSGQTDPEVLFKAGGIIGAFLIDAEGLNLRIVFGRVGGLIVLYACALVGLLLFTETLFRDAGRLALSGMASILYPRALIARLGTLPRPSLPRLGRTKANRVATETSNVSSHQRDTLPEPDDSDEDSYEPPAPPRARRRRKRSFLEQVGRGTTTAVVMPFKVLGATGRLFKMDFGRRKQGRVLGGAPISHLGSAGEEYSAPPAIRQRELAGLRQDRSWEPRSGRLSLAAPDGYEPEQNSEGEWEEDVWVESDGTPYTEHPSEDSHDIDAEPWTEDAAAQAHGYGELVRRDQADLPAAAPKVADADAADEFLAARGTRLPNRVEVHSSWSDPDAREVPEPTSPEPQAPSEPETTEPSPERVEHVQRIETHDRKEHFERVERVERIEHVHRYEGGPDERERPLRSERTERSERAERAHRSERAERSSLKGGVRHLDRVERDEHAERAERSERTERVDHEAVPKANRSIEPPKHRTEPPEPPREDEPRANHNQRDLREFGASMSQPDERISEPVARHAEPQEEEAPPAFRLKRRRPEPEVEVSSSESRPRLRNVQSDQPEFDFKKGSSGGPRPYKLPGMDLLQQPPRLQYKMTQEDAEKLCRKIEETLAQFKVDVEVVEVVQGPTITRFALHIAPGIRVNKILQLENDLALALKAQHIRILAPIPGQAAVGIEVPNKKTNPVYLRDLMESETFQKSKSPLSFCLGKNIAGESVVADLTQMPHLLIAGATGAGKSVCLNTIIASLLYRNTPDKVRMIMIDPKRVELSIYQAIPHLMAPVVCEPRKAAAALAWAVEQMEKRYKQLSEISVRNIDGYNAVVLDKEPNKKAMGRDLKYMPHMVVIIDELADLMMVAKNEVEEYVIRLAQMARAVGIHLILATQRPSVNVITGIIKANFPSRIAFKVSSKVDSRTILDCNGAETLLGRGDMLYSPGGVKPFRLQGSFVADTEVESLADYIRSQEKARYEKDDFEALPTPAQRAKAKLMESAMPPQAKIVADGDPNVGYSGDDGASLAPPTAGRVTQPYLPPADVESLTDEDLYDVALKLVFESRKASVSYIQRRLKIGYARAGRIMDMMEERGIVGPYKGSKPRDIIVDPSEFGADNEDDPF